MAKNNRICKIDGCDKNTRIIRGMCKSHYNKWHRANRPDASIIKCSIYGCEKPMHAHTFCSMHAGRYRNHGDPLKLVRKVPEPCSVQGCETISSGQGLCMGHYHRMQRHGDPLIGGPLMTRAKIGAASEWLESHVLYQGDECLIWPFGGVGYGYCYVDGVGMNASRAMCVLAHGAPPSNIHEAAHSCGKGHEGCINPNHLRWATPKENQHDKIAHGTIVRGEDVWIAKLTEESVRYIRSKSGKITYAKLGKMFGVSRATVGDAIKRKTWAHVE